MARNIYPYSQEQLYATAEIAWNMYLLYIGDFDQFNMAYTTQFYEARIKEIKDSKEKIYKSIKARAKAAFSRA